LELESIRDFLEDRAYRYNQPSFIENDPISIPHLFTRKQDREIMGFWTAVLTWGQRITTIRKAKELIQIMDGSPYDFIKNHQDSDLKTFHQFKHRTFNLTDTLYFLAFFKSHYQRFDTLEKAFLLPNAEMKTEYEPETHLNAFREYFFSLDDFPKRTQKHVTSPQKSTAKRINMFLRWMVRKDNAGVDFGIWNEIRPSQLMMPLDVHVERVSRKLGLLERKQRDWKAVEELTQNLRLFDPIDPVRYDFALFNLGIEENF
jgi:uncharacterized protein (TIGR02757 family)